MSSNCLQFPVICAYFTNNWQFICRSQTHASGSDLLTANYTQVFI